MKANLKKLQSVGGSGPGYSLAYRGVKGGGGAAGAGSEAARSGGMGNDPDYLQQFH